MSQDQPETITIIERWQKDDPACPFVALPPMPSLPREVVEFQRYINRSLSMQAEVVTLGPPYEPDAMPEPVHCAADECGEDLEPGPSFMVAAQTVILEDVWSDGGRTPVLIPYSGPPHLPVRVRVPLWSRP